MPALLFLILTIFVNNNNKNDLLTLNLAIYAALGFKGTAVSGWISNCQDISPSHAGKF